MAPYMSTFVDFNWASCYDTHVSTNGFCFLLGDAYISWLSKKKPTMATSSCEVEYMATFMYTIAFVWLRHLLADLGVEEQSSTTIYTNS